MGVCHGTSKKGVGQRAKLRKMEVLRTGLVKKRILVTDVSQKVVFDRGGGGLRHGSGQKGGLYRGTYMNWTYMLVPPPPRVIRYVEEITYYPPPPFLHRPTTIQVNISNICRI